MYNIIIYFSPKYYLSNTDNILGDLKFIHPTGNIQELVHNGDSYAKITPKLYNEFVIKYTWY